MNRADRRRLEKQQGQSSQSPRRDGLQSLLNEAVTQHRAGRLQQAEQLYRQILATDPAHADALHFLGLLAYQVGRYERAAELIQQALQANPQSPHYWFNLGLVFYKQGKLGEAMEAYRRALHLSPGYVEAHNNLANALRDQGKLDEAVASYHQALKLNPTYVDAHNNLGAAYRDLGRLDQAVKAYEQALALDPTHAEAHNNLGMVLRDLGRLDDALASFQKAVRIKPDYAKAYHNLGVAWLWKERPDEALHSLRKAADLMHNHGRRVMVQSLYRSRIKHDVEQIHYLADRGLLRNDLAEYRDSLTQLQQRSGPCGLGVRILLNKQEQDALQPSFARILQYGTSEAMAGGALNPHLDVAAIEARYHAKKPETLYVDDLLTEPALRGLRTFCLESTIWKKDYENGYIGAFLGEGFSSPLLLQVAEELRVRFPNIFKDHRLTQAWAFKYDSELTGLNIHADAAAVNVNFWITPDEANLDPDHGGLVVWDKEAPKEWNFKEYNNKTKEPLIREFLEKQGAQAITIPYRANRAVIFNSDLFHETDRLRFKDEYESRRINITLLYGHRSA